MSRSSYPSTGAAASGDVAISGATSRVSNASGTRSSSHGPNCSRGEISGPVRPRDGQQATAGQQSRGALGGSRLRERRSVTKNGPGLRIGTDTVDFHSAARVLLIEDNEDIREGLSTLLESESYDVVALGSAEEGLASLRRQAFEVVITDYMLPGESGGWMIEQAAQGVLPQGHAAGDDHRAPARGSSLGSAHPSQAAGYRRLPARRGRGAAGQPPEHGADGLIRLAASGSARA